MGVSNSTTNPLSRTIILGIQIKIMSSKSELGDYELDLNFRGAATLTKANNETTRSRFQDQNNR